jgi:hypothetical protein
MIVRRGKNMNQGHLANQVSKVPGKSSDTVSTKKVVQEVMGNDRKSIMSKYAGSIEFSDEEFAAMLQELKDSK